jgi:hypothetical protein
MGSGRITAQLRRDVETRAQWCCEYCRSQASVALQSFAVDHIQPRNQGGETTLENLASSCPGCNAHKYNKSTAIDPLSGERVPLYHPRNDRWEEHFAWSSDFTLIVGLTPSGRATVEGLNMNREGVVKLRRLLLAAGEHPPETRRA